MWPSVRTRADTRRWCSVIITSSSESNPLTSHAVILKFYNNKDRGLLRKPLITQGFDKFLSTICLDISCNFAFLECKLCKLRLIPFWPNIFLSFCAVYCKKSTSSLVLYDLTIKAEPYQKRFFSFFLHKYYATTQTPLMAVYQFSLNLQKGFFLLSFTNFFSLIH